MNINQKWPLISVLAEIEEGSEIGPDEGDNFDMVERLGVTKVLGNAGTT